MNPYIQITLTNEHGEPIHTQDCSIRFQDLQSVINELRRDFPRCTSVNVHIEW